MIPINDATNSSTITTDIVNNSGIGYVDYSWTDFNGSGTTCDNNFSSLFNATDKDHLSGPKSLQVPKVFWALLMIPLPLVAVVGNILVILSVYKERTLQSATNYFIVSLAFADLLVAAVVMPFAVYVLVNVDWELSDTLCDFYIALDVTCSTASIFNLVAISVDRFIAVTQPIKYSKHKNNKRVFLTIAFVWLVSAAIGSPIVLGLNTSPERQPNLCVFYNSDFIIYSSLSSFYIPCLVMVYLYYKIFRAIHERARKAIGHKMPTNRANNKDGVVIENAQTDHRNQIDSPSDSSKHSVGVAYIKTLSPLMEGDEVSQVYPSENVDDDEDDEEESPTAEVGDCQVISNVAASSSQESYTMTDLESCCKSPSSQELSPTCRLFKINGSAADNRNFVQPLVDSKSTSKKKNMLSLIRPQKNKKKKREKNVARRERKATKTLAIVLGVFLICWVPFFTCNILDAICIKLESDTWRPGVTVFLLTTWLGYINSCVNPVIYTIFNLEFRKAFKKLLLEPCK